MGSELLYGHWGYVLFYSITWSSFVFVLIRPRMFREFAVFALFAIFLIAEFTELYGVPLSINLISRGFDPYYIGGGVLIFGGLGVLYYAWWVLKAAQASGVPAVTGPYGWVRHPQYLALISIMLGFIITLPVGLGICG